MKAAVVKPLDWLAIQLARLCVREGTAPDGQLNAAEALLHRPEFRADFVEAPKDFERHRHREFRFTSPVASPWKRNNTVHGRFFPVGGRWQERPTMILLHGWNNELGYQMLFPYLARRFNGMGINAIIFELPYHRQRKPRGRGTPNNFLSGDLLHVVSAFHQAIADARALVAWLRAQGCERIGVWGLSLGGWLAGMLACVEPRLSLAVLMIPVVRMDRVITELDFCRPIRRRLDGRTMKLDPLNLITYRPKLSPDRILVVASEHDMFAPRETTEELCRAWNKPTLWHPRHGHISTMMSAPVMHRAMGWVAGKLS